VGTSIGVAPGEMAMVPFVPQMDRGESLYRFKQMLIGKLDHLTMV